MPGPTSVRSFSKINLGLRIGLLQADGFHRLTTLFQTVALHDVVTVSAEPAGATEITLESNDPRLPRDRRNTAYRMVETALDAMGVTARVQVHLQKNLPPQGGMGAGSANAAAALLGLERQIAGWGRSGHRALGGPQRLRLAEAVGSDVPVFLLGGTVYAHNRGELVVPYPDLPSAPCVVVLPGVGSSTPAAFRAWDERMASVTAEDGQARLDQLSRVYGAAAIPQVRAGASVIDDAFAALADAGLENDFEEVVFVQHPFLRAIKRALLGSSSGGPSRGDPSYGDPGLTRISAEPTSDAALLAMLSGSGSSLFGLYRTSADAEAAQRRVLEVPGGGGVRALLTHTVSRREYWETMFPA